MDHTNPPSTDHSSYYLSIISFLMTIISSITPAGIIQVLTIAVLILTLIKLKRDLKNKKSDATD